MAVDVGSAVGYLDLDISKFLSGLKSAQDEAGKTSKSITDKLDSVGDKLTSVGKKTTALVTAPIVGAGTAIVKTSANFESAMSKVSAISGATGDDLDALTEKAKQMGESTKFSASESADAFQYMAMAGWKTEQMLDGIEGIMNLAAASGEDLATTSDIVTDALTAFGLSAEDSSHFADVLAAASSNANTNVSMLGESFKYVAPLAGALGYSAEDVGVALGLMANAGIKSSQAGTALRSAISGLISPSKEAVGWMENLGLSITNEDGSMKSLAEVMDMLRDKMSGLTEAEQAEAASALFGERAMSGMLAIINASESDYNKLTEALANADGTAKQMADTMNDNLNGQLVLLKSQIEGVAIKLGNILIPIIKKIVDKISEAVDWFSNLSEEQQKMILRIAGIVAAIGPLLLIIGKVIKTISTIIKIVNAIKTAVIALNAILAANPVILIIAAIIAAITALVAIFVHLYKTNEDFRNKVNAAWEKIKEVVGSVIDFIKKAWQALWDFVGPILEKAWENIKAVWDYMAPYFETLWNAIKSVFSIAAKVLGGFFETAWKVIKAVWDPVVKFFEAIWAGIKAVFAVVKGVLTGDFSGAAEAIKNAWSKIIDFFKSIWNAIKSIFSAVKEWFADAFRGAIEAIITVWSAVHEFFQGIWDGIKEIFASVGEWFKEKFYEAVALIITVWSAVHDFFAGVWEGIKNVFASIGNWFKEKFQEAVDNIKAVFITIVVFVESIREKIKNVFANIGKWFKDKFQEAIDNIKAVFSVIGDFFKERWENIKATFAVVGTFFKDKFTEAWNNIKAVFSGIGDFFSGIWDKIVNIFKNVGTKIGESVSGAFKSVVNRIFEFIEEKINGFIGMINGVIDFINEIPGVDLGHLDYVSLPRLAKGGLAYGPTAAIVGDNKNAVTDPEVITPLSKLKEMIAEVILVPLNKMVAIQERMANQFATTMQTKIIDITPMVVLLEELVNVSKMNYSYNLSKTEKANQQESDRDQRGSTSGGGDTYNFYTNNQIDEEEAARQIKRVKRDIAEGF